MDSFTLKMMPSPEIEKMKGELDSPIKSEEKICFQIEQVDSINNRTKHSISHIEINPLFLSDAGEKEEERMNNNKGWKKEEEKEEEGKNETRMRNDEGGGNENSKYKSEEEGEEGKEMAYMREERGREERERLEKDRMEEGEEEDWDFELSLEEEEADDISEERSKVEYLPEDGIKRLIVT